MSRRHHRGDMAHCQEDTRPTHDPHPALTWPSPSPTHPRPRPIRPHPHRQGQLDGSPAPSHAITTALTTCTLTCCPTPSLALCPVACHCPIVCHRPVACHRPVMCCPATTAALYTPSLLPFVPASPACISPPYHASRAPSDASQPPPPRMSAPHHACPPPTTCGRGWTGRHRCILSRTRRTGCHRGWTGQHRSILQKLRLTFGN